MELGLQHSYSLQELVKSVILELAPAGLTLFEVTWLPPVWTQEPGDTGFQFQGLRLRKPSNPGSYLEERAAVCLNLKAGEGDESADPTAV